MVYLSAKSFVMHVEEIRQEFPQLAEKVYGRPLVYLDNAATSLRPRSVVAKWEEMSTRYNANLHRAVHRMAQVATDEYESARDAVKEFIGAAHREEIVFTSGATASLNLVAFCLGESMIRKGDEILVAESEHHSDIIPWQQLCARKGAKLRVLPVEEDGTYDLQRFESCVSENTRIVCIAQISNVLGVVNPIKEMARICHERGALILVDGAQGIVHQEVNVQDLGCDFYLFSGHKMYAAPGTGVLYGRRELLEQLPPYMGGGEMIARVQWSGSSFAAPPQRFEAGTQNISGVPTWKPAIEMVRRMRDPEILAGQDRIRDFMLDALSANPRIRLFGTPEKRGDRIPLFSFAVEGAHHEDLALILDKRGIAVRSGQMCAEPLMDRFGVSGMLRASFAPYNTLQEAEYLMESLDRAIGMLTE